MSVGEIGAGDSAYRSNMRVDFLIVGIAPTAGAVEDAGAKS
jgi:hypothetical protein